MFVSADGVAGSAVAYCHLKKFGGAGSYRTNTLSILGGLASVNLQSLEVYSSASTNVFTGIECLSAGQHPCAPDAAGNIGTAGGQNLPHTLGHCCIRGQLVWTPMGHGDGWLGLDDTRVF